MKALIVYNPFAKTNRINKKINYIKKSLSIAYDTIDVYESEGIRTITKYVYEHINEYNLLIISGGDGTVNEAISGVIMAKSKVPVSIIPAGTVNDLAKLLGYSKNIKKNINTILYGTDAFMDACKINDEYFTYACAIGKYTDVSYTARRGWKKILGRLAYFFEGLHEFAKYTKMGLKITFDDCYIQDRFYVLFGLNTNTVAGFKIDKKGDTKLNDGLIDLTLIDKSTVTWTKLAKFFLFGNKVKKGIRTYKVSHIEIESNELLEVNTDGEHKISSNVVDIKVLKEVLNVRISRRIKRQFFIRKRTNII